jgi:hypothetical protein
VPAFAVSGKPSVSRGASIGTISVSARITGSVSARMAGRWGAGSLWT